MKILTLHIIDTSKELKMNKIIKSSIQRWRAQRNKRMLQSPYSTQYAFVGVGSHALQNLYPVLQYLGIQIKYICCKSLDKLPIIERRFGVVATTSLDIILNDDDVKGVFVCTSPHLHYDICSRVISSGKYLFVEKPPCRTFQQLENLIEADVKQKCMVGMQKRYSPLIETLKVRLSKTELISYSLSYHTGAYPEGDLYSDLFIHPVDLALNLFGKAELKSKQLIECKGTTTVLALLSHSYIRGGIDISTAYSWSNPKELLSVNTSSGEYRLENMERLLFYPHPKKIGGLPIEKLGFFKTSEIILTGRNNFNPIISNNQVYTHGFLSEIKSFADMVEFSDENHSPLSSLIETYKILNSMRN